MDKQIRPEPLETTKGRNKQRITPFLWFDNQAVEAADFYVSVFKNARIRTTTWQSEESAAASRMPAGSVLTVAFQIEGVDFTALNGGPVFKLSPAISFMVSCRTREKVDELWAKLIEGGKSLMEIGQYPYSERYGWVEDKYGVSWQLILNDDSQIIAPCIMFPGKEQKGEDAINYYMSVFENSAVERIERYTAEEEGPTGAMKYGAFSLDGQNFKAMDSGREMAFGLNPSISFVVNCDSQKELDYYWDKLTAGGDEYAQQCGWLQDRYGVSWQVVPENLGLMLSDPNSEKGKNVMHALMKMKKLDMNILQAAYQGKQISEKETIIDFQDTGANYEGSEHSYRKQETLNPNEEL